MDGSKTGTEVRNEGKCPSSEFGCQEHSGSLNCKYAQGMKGLFRPDQSSTIDPLTIFRAACLVLFQDRDPDWVFGARLLEESTLLAGWDWCSGYLLPSLWAWGILRHRKPFSGSAISQDSLCYRKNCKSNRHFIKQ